VHFDDLVLLAGVIQHAFGGRRLASVDVRDDADVAVKLELFLPSHDLALFEVFGYASELGRVGAIATCLKKRARNVHGYV
jgi:hypothetical protein